MTALGGGAFGRGSGREGGARMSGIGAPRGLQRLRPEDTVKRRCLCARKRPSLDTTYAGPSLGCPASTAGERLSVIGEPPPVVLRHSSPSRPRHRMAERVSAQSLLHCAYRAPWRKAAGAQDRSAFHRGAEVERVTCQKGHEGAPAG